MVFGFLRQAKEAKEQAVKEWNKGWGPYPNNDKAAQMAVGCCGAVSKDVDYIHTLQKDLASSIYWSGNFCKDYCFYVCNWHAWVGVLLCHPNHPWTKFDRFMMQIISLAISIIPSAVIAKISSDAVEELEEDLAAGLITDLEFTAKKTAALGSRLMVTTVFVTIPCVIYTAIMYQVAVSDTRCPRCSCFWNKCKKCLFCFTLSSGIFFSLIGFLIMGTGADWGYMTYPLLMSQVTSAVIWFPLYFLLPCRLGFWSRWDAEQKALQAVVPESNEIQVQPSTLGKQ